MAADLADKEFVADQYREATNLNARILLHQRFSLNKYGWQRWVFDQLCFPKQGRLLELGCGTGALWLENVDRLPLGWDITLSDLSPGMLHEARQQLGGNPSPFRFAIVDAQSIPLASRSLDSVVANHMLYHVPDRARALSEIRRLLKPGGRFYASTIGREHLCEITDLLRRFDPRLARSSERPYSAFTLENGAAQLQAWFAHVRLARYEDALVVTEPAPLVDYILSGRTELTADEQPAFTAFVEQEFQRCDGRFYISKESGIFECWAPRAG